MRLNIGVNDDLGGAIFVNMYVNSENKDIDKIGIGSNVRIRGVAYIDEFSKSLTIKGQISIYYHLMKLNQIQQK